MTALNDLFYRLTHAYPEMVVVVIGIFVIFTILVLIDKMLDSDTSNWKRHDDR